MTPAEEITAAAVKLEGLLNTLGTTPDVPFHTEACDSEMMMNNCPCIVSQGYKTYPGEAPTTALFYIADAETPELAAFIAVMGPPLARIVVATLKSRAGFDINESTALSEDFTSALAMARQINRDHTQ